MTNSGLNANTRYAALITIDHDLERLDRSRSRTLGNCSSRRRTPPSSIGRLIASPTSLLGALHK